MFCPTLAFSAGQHEIDRDARVLRRRFDQEQAGSGRPVAGVVAADAAASVEFETSSAVPSRRIVTSQEIGTLPG